MILDNEIESAMKEVERDCEALRARLTTDPDLQVDVLLGSFEILFDFIIDLNRRVNDLEKQNED